MVFTTLNKIHFGKIPIVNIDTGFSILSVILYYEYTQRWPRSSPNRDEVCGSRVDQNYRVLPLRNGGGTPRRGRGLEPINADSTSIPRLQNLWVKIWAIWY